MTYFNFFCCVCEQSDVSKENKVAMHVHVLILSCFIWAYAFQLHLISFTHWFMQSSPINNQWLLQFQPLLVLQ